MKHLAVVHNPECVDFHCPICHGGLFQCSVCHGVEGSLTHECCGESLDYDTLQAVYEGNTNFINGKWTMGHEPNT